MKAGRRNSGRGGAKRNTGGRGMNCGGGEAEREALERTKPNICRRQGFSSLRTRVKRPFVLRIRERERRNPRRGIYPRPGCVMRSDARKPGPTWQRVATRHPPPPGRGPGLQILPLLNFFILFFHFYFFHFPPPTFSAIFLLSSFFASFLSILRHLTIIVV